MAAIRTLLIILTGWLLAGVTAAATAAITVAGPGLVADIVPDNQATMRLAGALLQRDLQSVSGQPVRQVRRLEQYGAMPLAWRATDASPGLTLAASAGTLNDGNGYEQRIAVRYDGGETMATGALKLACGSAALNVNLRLVPGAAPGVATEHDRIITLAATAAVAEAGGWTPVASAAWAAPCAPAWTCRPARHRTWPAAPPCTTAFTATRRAMRNCV